MTKITFESVARLEEIGEISIQTGPFGTQLKASEYTEMGTPVINVRNIGYRIEKDAALERIPERVVEKLKQHKLLAGDIVFGRKGAVDRHLIVKKKQSGWVQGSDCIRIRLKSKNLDRDFLSYFFLTEGHKKWMEAQGAFGATMGSLNQGIIRRISFPDFPFNIQRKIAAVLSAYDDLIENNNRRIAILEKMAEELYREWFVRLRFPGHEKTKIIKGIPEGWEVKNVGKVFERYIGGGWGEDFQMPNNPVGAFVIRGTDIPDLKTGKYKLPPFRFHKQTNFASRVLKVGDIIFEVAGGSKTQLLGRSLLISEGIHNFCQKKLICASFCKLIRPAISPFYLSSFLNAFYDCGLVGIFQTQSTGISNYHFEDFVKFQTIAVPSKELLNQFDATMEKIVSQKDNFAQQNWFLSNSRDKLLSRLMSGKIDLENLDIQFPASMQEEE